MRWPPWAPKTPPTEPEQEARTAANNDPRHNYTNLIDWNAFTEPRTLIATSILTTGILGAVSLHGRYFRWFPDAVSISPSYLRRRSLLGRVTSVGDGDNFRMYHTPGGRLAGWGWLPWKKIPTSKKELRDKTIHIRLAGIDAPELAHFGRPAQPFGKEAHEWLTAYLTNRRVRAYVHRQDQYQRVVATVTVRRALDFPIPFRRRDVSYEMLKKGLATVYEAKTGAEFGGAERERKYRQAEWWAKLRGLGMWKGFRRNDAWESPRDYKTRMGLEDPMHVKGEVKKK
ncbi:thermonuclease family protein [Aspergillus saccharolyticus JOP 1030-1]|uniref:Probable endonuclease LCL3 n=1 Tax=Aspergillus saccharolyticus JOP 1030-1 TaxID=1450539 RepID=A0A318ZR85_9EURO|nr:staphylococcal nuclease domain protein [Aspergillus saccharolyticus JOP 1030-1]PYH50036.1 staphylococcal nuclease domain protein [Aspergillus saccharolyticus JOP 1030-1]